jgi:glycosyltransferase involved in cell wall biosynthesis
MKVGLYPGPHQIPEMGGGYTFQDDVLRALEKAAGTGPHTFVVFGSEPGNEGRSNGPFPLHSLSRGVWKRAASRLAQWSSGEQAAEPEWIERMLVDTGVELMCHLSSEYLSTAIPYIQVVWDVQHRLNPIFPEVAGRHWTSRERLHELALRKAALLVTGTSAGKAELEFFYQIPPPRITVLPHPTPRFALEAPPDDGRNVLQKFALPEGYLLYPAQFWPHKNHVTLLQALALLKKEHGLEVALALVGSDRGNERHVKECTAELGLRDQVHFLGFVSRDDIVALYRRAAALVYVSFFGPENLPPLEAFALGCPVIAARVPGSEEQLGEAAILVDPASPEQIAAAVRSLRDHPSRRADLVARGHDRARRFTGEDFASGLISMIDTLAPLRRCWSSRDPYRSP